MMDPTSKRASAALTAPPMAIGDSPMTPTSVQRRQEARQQLERAVEALAQSDGWQAWVATRSTFRRYSISNTFMIAMQRQDATRVAGYKAWQKLGRQVRKGEKGITILAPMPFK